MLGSGATTGDPTIATTIGLDRAHRTLRDATVFLAAGLRPAGGAAAIRGPMRARVIGNGLRELDRFLNVLVDAAAVAAGLAATDRDRLAPITNTADKLALFYALLALDAPCRERLIALGRMRACLFYRDGAIGPGLAADRRGADWLAATGRAAGSGRIEVDSAELGDICAYYEALARGIRRATAGRSDTAIAQTPLLLHIRHR